MERDKHRMKKHRNSEEKRKSDRETERHTQCQRFPQADLNCLFTSQGFSTLVNMMANPRLTEVTRYGTRERERETKR